MVYNEGMYIGNGKSKLSTEDMMNKNKLSYVRKLEQAMFPWSLSSGDFHMLSQVDQSDNWVSSDPISILSESDRIISDCIGSW